jgi:uncharacterized protein (DUF305 family)
MAEMIDESKNEEVQALREAIIKSQRAEIEEMKTLLASLN